MEIKNFAVGADIESIDRFRKLDSINNPLLNRIFTKNELNYCFSKEDKAPHLAARYCGKEAIIKALSGISRSNLDYKDIEIFNNDEGVPKVKFSDKSLNKLQIMISLSHCSDKALAFAVVIKVDSNER